LLLDDSYRQVLSLHWLSVKHRWSDMQDGVTDVQDNVFLNASVFEQPNPDGCSSSSCAVIRRHAADCRKNAKISTRTNYVTDDRWQTTHGPAIA